MKTINTITLACAAIFFVVQGNAKAALTHHYTFDGNAQDTIGTAHGTMNSGASITADPSKIKSGSGAYQGVAGNSRMTLPQIDFGNAMTVAGWFWTNSSGPSTLIANRATGAFQNGFHLYTNSGRIVLETANGSSFNASLSTVGVVTTGAYHHLAMTINRTTGISRLYWDGADVTDYTFDAGDNGAVRNDFGNNNSEATAGSSSFNYGFALAGFIDDLRIYDEVLSSSDVAILAGVVPEPATIALLPVAFAASFIARRRITTT